MLCRNSLMRMSKFILQMCHKFSGTQFPLSTLSLHAGFKPRLDADSSTAHATPPAPSSTMSY